MAISSYNSLVAAYGQEGAYSLIQGELARSPEVQQYSIADIDQVVEDLTRSAEVVHAAPAPAPQADNTSLLASLLGIK